MAKVKISEFNSNPALNTDIDSINIAEGCSPSGINDAIRELMSQLKDWQSGTSNDPYVVGSSGSLTLNQGTANGVAYLNGSKVVTSGSALTFDGTNLGIGGAVSLYFSGSNKGIGITGSTNGAEIDLKRSGGAGTSYLVQGSNDSLYFGNEANYPIIFNVNATEQMRLTSTGLGIGTSSPASKLAVVGEARVYTGSNLGYWGVDGGNSYVYFGSNSSGYSLSFQTGGADRMRLDSSGNLGLGVTPSAWGSGYKALQVGLYSALNYGEGKTNITTNAYYNGTNWIYANSDIANMYKQGSFHAWYNAPSGTAGNAITFTQAMTLDASGNLGVGTTSPTQKLSVYVSSGGSWGGFGDSVTTASSPNLFGSDGTGAAAIYTPAAYPIKFYTNTTERARIDSSGNLLVGTTGLDGKFRVEQDGVSWARTTNHLYNGAQYFDSFRYNGTQIGAITGNNTATAYNTSSDYRLKNTIAPMTGALAKVAQLKPCTYKWNADGSDGEGFIAHELAEVVPQCVTGEKDAVDENGNPKYQGIDTSFLVATLTAALQEAHGLIKSLEARVVALEAK